MNKEKFKVTAREVKKLRENAQLTQKQAAELVHVEARSWQRWEHGERQMTQAHYELFLFKTQQNLDEVIKK